MFNILFSSSFSLFVCMYDEDIDTRPCGSQIKILWESVLSSDHLNGGFEFGALWLGGKNIYQLSQSPLFKHFSFNWIISGTNVTKSYLNSYQNLPIFLLRYNSVQLSSQTMLSFLYIFKIERWLDGKQDLSVIILTLQVVHS